MSAAAAALRSACRALRRPSPSLPRSLAANEQPFFFLQLHRPPTTTPRRIYSSGGAKTNQNQRPRGDRHFLERHLLNADGSRRNPGYANSIVPEEFKGRSIHMTPEQVGDILSTRTNLICFLLEEKFKCDRRRRMLVRGSIFLGLAIYVKHKFFAAGSERRGRSRR